VNESIGKIVDGVLSARSSQVSLLVDEDFGVAVDRGHKDVGSDIELPSMD
jgi:hypothetical protein